MSEKRLTGSIAISKLKHAIFTTKAGNKCLLIPIKENMLVEGKEVDGVCPVYMPVSVTVKEETDQYGQNGFIAKMVDSKDWKNMTDPQKEASKELSPILGNIKDWGSAGSANDAGGQAQGNFTEEEHDDLPF